MACEVLARRQFERAGGGGERAHLRRECPASRRRAAAAGERPARHRRRFRPGGGCPRWCARRALGALCGRGRQRRGQRGQAARGAFAAARNGCARGARFRCAAVYLAHPTHPTPVVREAPGKAWSWRRRAGDGGFGYDPVFLDPRLGAQRGGAGAGAQESRQPPRHRRSARWWPPWRRRRRALAAATTELMRARDSRAPRRHRCRVLRAPAVVRAQVPLLRFQLPRAAAVSSSEARYVDALLADLDTSCRGSGVAASRRCSSAAAPRACSRQRSIERLAGRTRGAAAVAPGGRDHPGSESRRCRRGPLFRVRCMPA